MIKQYYKQALAQLRQHPLISIIVGSDDATSKGRSFFSRVQS